MAYDNTALLVVDCQCAFSELCPAELPIPGALAIVPRVNQLLELPWRRVDATQDWHPIDHCSFLGRRDNLHPSHAVAGTRGAEFLPGLKTHMFRAIFRKGFERDRDAYSVLEQHPGYVDLLRGEGVDAVVVCGLAANICCFQSARGLRAAGFRVAMVEDASAGIDVPELGLDASATKRAGIELGIEYVPLESMVARGRVERREQDRYEGARQTRDGHGPATQFLESDGPNG